MSVLRRGLVAAACFSLFGLAACGGGGGGGTSAGPPPVVATPTPSPTPAPVQQSASLVAAGQPASAAFPAIATGISGGVTVAAATAGAGTTIQATLNAALPAGTPQLSTLRRHPQAIGAGGITGLAFVTLTPGANVAFGATPSFSFAFAPSAPGAGTSITPNPAYIAVYDPTNAAAGWQTLLGPQTVGGGTASATFTGTPTPTVLSAGKTYVYALFIASSAVAVPTPTPSPAPSGAPSSSPGPVQALPATGVMPALGTGFGGATSAGAAGALVVGIANGHQSSDGKADAARGSVTVAVAGSAGTSARRRVQSRFVRDAAFGVDAPTGASRAAVREIMQAPKSGGHTATLPQSVRRPRAAIGDVQQFWAQNAAIGASGGTYSQHPAQLVASTAHWQIWVDTSLTSVIGNASTVSGLAADFENAYTSDTAHFASNDYSGSSGWSLTVPYCDATGAKTSRGPQIVPPQTQTIAFVVGPGTLGTGVGGYFDQLNYFPDAEVQCFAGARKNGLHSNGVPMVYVGWSTANSANSELKEDIVRGSAHEFQHLINFAQHDIIQNGNNDEDPFVNEGLSVLAQDLAVPAMFPALAHDVDDALYHADEFLSAPANFSLTGFSGIDADDPAASPTVPAYNCSGCYGASFVFQRYLYDHYGGDTYLHAIENGPDTGMAHVAVVTGRDGGSLLTDFGIALAANGQSSDARYAWNFPFGQNLTSQFGTTGHLVSKTTPVNATPGGGTFAGPYDGGYVFVQVPAGGKTITITETSGLPGFLAGIAQH